MDFFIYLLSYIGAACLGALVSTLIITNALAEGRLQFVFGTPFMTSTPPPPYPGDRLMTREEWDAEQKLDERFKNHADEAIDIANS